MCMYENDLNRCKQDKQAMGLIHENYFDMACLFVFETAVEQEWNPCYTFIGHKIVPYLMNDKRKQLKLFDGQTLNNLFQQAGQLSVWNGHDYVFKQKDGKTCILFSYTLKVPRSPDCDYFTIRDPDHIRPSHDEPFWFGWDGKNPAPVFYDQSSNILFPLMNQRYLLFATPWYYEPNGYAVLTNGFVSCNGRTLHIEDSGDRSPWIRKVNGYWVCA